MVGLCQRQACSCWHLARKFVDRTRAIHKKVPSRATCKELEDWSHTTQDRKCSGELTGKTEHYKAAD